jgi:hypothetical protein
VGLWIGTFVYFTFFDRSVLIVNIVDYCWFQFVGALTMGFALEIEQDFKRGRRDQGSKP